MHVELLLLFPIFSPIEPAVSHCRRGRLEGGVASRSEKFSGGRHGEAAARGGRGRGEAVSGSVVGDAGRGAGQRHAEAGVVAGEE